MNSGFRIFIKAALLALTVSVLLCIAVPALAASYSYDTINGTTIYLNIGDTLYLTNPRSSYGMSMYDYSINLTQGDSVEVSDYGKSANVVAVKSGTSVVTAYLDGSVPITNYGTKYNIATKEWESYTYITYESRNYKDVLTVIVRDNTPPKLSSLPDKVIVAEGKTASVKLSATTGSGTDLSYQWYYANAGSSTFYKASITTPEYSVPMTDARNGRRIYCVVTDGNGKSTKSETVTLKMAAPITITTQPKSISAEPGATAKLTVKATGEGTLKYQWYIKNSGASKYSKSSTTTATYSVAMNPERDGRKLYCVITDAYGQKATTNTVTISMKSTLGIHTQPTDANAPLNETVTVKVGATGSGTLKYQWYYKEAGGSKFYKSSTTTSTYSVAMTSARNGRQLYCVVTDGSGNKVTSNTVTISVTPTLKIATQPKSVKAVAGKTATVSVKVTGGSGVSYQWYYCEAGSSTFYKSSIKTASYSVTMTDARNGRKLYCVVTDEHGQKVKTNTVTISIPKPITITSQPLNAGAVSGQNVTVQVVASGEGTLKYQWYYCNAGSSTYGKSSVTSSRYTTTMDSSRDGRLVYCVVSDSYGQSVKSEAAKLTMAKPLIITSQPVDTKFVAFGNHDPFRVAASGTGPLTYDWYVKFPGKTEFELDWSETVTTGYSTYKLMGLSFAVSEVYCVVSDTYGQSVTSNTVLFLE